jgi:hypothetical protein
MCGTDRFSFNDVQSNTKAGWGVKMAHNKKRLNLDLTPDAYEELQRLAESSGKNMADVLRTGLKLYSLVQEESRDGKNLGIVKDNKVVKEIVVIT